MNDRSLISSRIPSPIFDVLLQAFRIAEAEGAPEIGVHHLLAALAVGPFEKATTPLPGGPFVPIPRRDLGLSREAQAAMKAMGTLDQLKTDSIRSALVAVKPDTQM